ncbi:MAG: S41 family peptidase [Cytophagales bacterium]|nr:S41 family peptidase [Cytophagales bacterium]
MKRISLYLLLLFFFAGCEEAFLAKDPAPDPVTSFDVLWRELDAKYALFAHKRVDWDSVYRVYRPQVRNDMSRQELFGVMAAMLNTLRDGHVNLRSEFNISKYENWFLDYPPNLNRELLIHRYWGDYHITGPLINTLIGDVGYVYYGSFVRPIAPKDLDYVFTRFKTAKGLIIDIRSNEGGNPANGFAILERIIRERTYLYQHAFKSGPGRTAFEPFRQVYLDPAFDKIRYEGKVVVLTNRRCYSAANYFAAMCRSAGILLVGDQTGGGGGVPAGSELPNGFFVNYSGSVCLLPNGYNIEDGIPPDVPVGMEQTDQNQGVDTIIERALQSF